MVEERRAEKCSKTPLLLAARDKFVALNIFDRKF
jgi:hypothetical protein